MYSAPAQAPAAVRRPASHRARGPRPPPLDEATFAELRSLRSELEEACSASGAGGAEGCGAALAEARSADGARAEVSGCCGGGGGGGGCDCAGGGEQTNGAGIASCRGRPVEGHGCVGQSVEPDGRGEEHGGGGGGGTAPPPRAESPRGVQPNARVAEGARRLCVMLPQFGLSSVGLPPLGETLGEARPIERAPPPE